MPKKKSSLPTHGSASYAQRYCKFESLPQKEAATGGVTTPTVTFSRALDSPAMMHHPGSIRHCGIASRLDRYDMIERNLTASSSFSS